MQRRTRTQDVKEQAIRGSELAWQLAGDKRFRRQLRSAIEHGTRASDRARSSLGLTGVLNRLVSDQALLTEVRRARRDLERAYGRLDAQRSRRRLRALALLALASLAAAPALRDRLPTAVGRLTKRGGAAPTPRRLEDLSKEELYARAQEAEISRRSEMSKDELIEALRARG
jgi:hypothetical protein